MRDRDAIARFRALAIPPAWTQVWICADPDGHVQAIGRDAKGRLQYRYHPAWRAARDRDKYGRLIGFCRALPALRRRVTHDLAQPGVTLDTATAAVIALIERGYLRVGNDEYARLNHSYGATTLELRHLRLHGDHVELRYRGKSGIDRHVSIRDGTLAEVLRRLRALPGARLFQHERDGKIRAVTASDVNRYVHATMGEDFSAKDFRTWAATTSAALRLAACPRPDTERACAQAIRSVIAEVAERLGHTPTVCRTSYIHPAVPAAFRAGTLAVCFPHAARLARAFDAGVGRAACDKGLIALLQRADDLLADDRREVGLMAAG